MWFCNFLKEAFDDISQKGYVFISNRDKGLVALVCTVFPQSYPVHCCQHIVDNVQTNFRAKCWPLFQRCAQARDQKSFKDTLKELQKVDRKAAEYVDAIPHKT